MQEFNCVPQQISNNMKIITKKAVKRIIIGLVLLSIICLIVGQFYCIIEVPPYIARRAPNIKFAPAKYGKGELVFENGIPVLILRGSPQEIGEQQGQLLKPQLSLSVDTYLTRFLNKESTKDIAINAMRRMKPFVPQAYQLELEEMSKVTAISYDRLLLLQTIIDEPRMPCCSAIMASEPTTGQPGIIFGRNLDFPSLGVAERYSLITVYHPENKKVFASITWPGFVGVLSGINEDGLSLALLLSLSSWETNTAGTPSMMLLRKILEEASNVEEAIKIINQAKRVSPINLALADAHNNSAVIEIAWNKTQVRYPDKSGLLYCTNWFMSKEMASLTGQAYLGSPVGATGGGDYRYDTIGRLAKEYYGEIGLTETIDILKSVALFRINLQSMVIYPQDKVVYLAIGSLNAAKEEFRKVDLMPYFKQK